MSGWYTYYSLHIQYLQRGSWGWTITVQNMYSWYLSTNKCLTSATTLCILLECIYIAKNDTRTFQCQVHTHLHANRFQKITVFLKDKVTNYKITHQRIFLFTCQFTHSLQQCYQFQTTLSYDSKPKQKAVLTNDVAHSVLFDHLSHNKNSVVFIIRRKAQTC